MAVLAGSILFLFLPFFPPRMLWGETTVNRDFGHRGTEPQRRFRQLSNPSRHGTNPFKASGMWEPCNHHRWLQEEILYCRAGRWATEGPTAHSTRLNRTHMIAAVVVFSVRVRRRATYPL